MILFKKHKNILTILLAVAVLIVGLSLQLYFGNNKAHTAYSIANSARFNDDDSAYLSKTLDSGGDRKTWTYSAWVKRGNLGVEQMLISSHIEPAEGYLKFTSSDTLDVLIDYQGGMTTTAVYRDPAAWHHIVLTTDATNTTATLYVDGEVAVSESINNADGAFNYNIPHSIGRHQRYPGDYADLYMSDVYFIDGQALTPSSFGETNTSTGEWAPKAYAGTYGTNGFYLDFEASGDLGNDVSGNDNDWTSNNLDATDQRADTPTDNHFTWSSIDKHANAVLSNGNLKAVGGISGGARANATLQPISGKWHYEFVDNGTIAGGLFIGLATDDNTSPVGNTGYPGTVTGSWGFGMDNGTTFRVRANGGSFTDYTLPYTFVAGDSLIVDWDADEKNIWFGAYDVSAGNTYWLNGSGSFVTTFPSTDPTYIAAGATNLYPQVGLNTSSYYGSLVNESADFVANVPTGYLALSTANMPTTYRQYDDSVLYIDGDGTDASTTFTDEAKSHHTITANGDAQVDTAQSKFGGASMQFDGSGDYLSMPDSDDWDFGDGDFTIDMWVRIANTSTKHEFIGQGSSEGTRWSLFFHNSWGMQFNAQTSGTPYISLYEPSPAGWSADTWYHVAIVRSGDDFSIYKDGTEVASSTDSSAMPNESASLMVGAGWDSSSFRTSGHIDDLRITKGLARWTTNFTPPTSAHGAPYTTQNKIQDPSDYFDVATYTGNGSTQSITGLDFQPDMVWAKGRSLADQHTVVDSVRGNGVHLMPNLTNGDTSSAQTIPAFNSDGFNVGTNTQVNSSGHTFVAWNWLESATSGFDIVSYTGDGVAGRTVAHNLGVRPDMIIVKNRTSSASWAVQHKSLGATKMIELDAAGVAVTLTNQWNDTEPDSSKFTVGTHGWVNTNTNNYIAYLFSEVPGYSKVGSYTGNGSADGPFVYTGFKPRYVMVKRTDAAGTHWVIWDTARDTYNADDEVVLKANLSDTEHNADKYNIDMLSNGFKIRGNPVDADTNTSGGNFIYYAIAETNTTMGPDTTAPILTEVTAVSTPTRADNANYTFSTDEAGTITYGGGCSGTTATTTATKGSNTITFTGLSNSTISNCTVGVTDFAGNASTALSLSSFTINNSLPYQLDNSARFNDDDSAYLSRTPTSAGDRKTWTWSGWVKRGEVDDVNMLFATPNFHESLRFQSGGALQFRVQNLDQVTNAVFRDPSTWYHVVWSVDVTQSTASERNRVYVNGVEQSFTGSNPANSDSLELNNTVEHQIGTSDNRFYLDGYLSDVHFVDGQALTPSSFGETISANGKWAPKPYTGTYGTNGFHLDFEASADLGNDVSGNDNDWTSNNMDATDQVIDNPTNNFAVLSSINKSSNATLYNGNLRITQSAAQGTTFSTIAPKSGKWYWELTQTNASDATNGIAPVDQLPTLYYPGHTDGGYGWWGGGGRYYEDGTYTSGHTSTSNSDTWQFAYDVDTGQLWYGKNGTWNDGDPALGTGQSEIASGDRWYVPAVSPYGGDITLNFGANALASLTDYTSTAGGYFKYEPPSGYKALSSKNIPVNYRQYDDTVLYIDGDGTDASTTFTDEAKHHHAVTSNGDAQVDTAQSKFGGASMLFDGTGDYLSIPDSDDWSFGSGDFTIDGWVRLNSSSGKQAVVQQYQNSSNSWFLSFDFGDSIGLNFKYYDGTPLEFYQGSNSGWSTDTWYHIAVVRDGDDWNIYRDGISIASTTSSASLSNFSATLEIGKRLTSAVFNGHIDDLRITKGLARWTTNFTPPTSAHGAPYTTQNKIQDPSDYFDVATYTGNGSTQSITGLNFQPDFTWLKNRDAADSHGLFDSVRTATKLLSSDTTAAESTDADTLTAFTSGGFSLGADVKYNTNTEDYVAWNWLESVTSGFDIVSYTGNGTARTIAHSLGTSPDLMIIKDRDGTNDWAVYHHANTTAPETDYVLLNGTAATADDATYWNDIAPSSETFSIGTNADVNTNTNDYIAYLFDEKPGYSKFGSYTGNGSADGPFIYTGFKPRYVMVRRVDASSWGWIIWDTERDTYNVATKYLEAQLANQEVTGLDIDVNSNGFKTRTSLNSQNASGGTYLYIAFADTVMEELDLTAPTLSETTAVTTPTRSANATYVFSSSEAGTITYGGGCSATTASTSATAGSNSITFTGLTDAVIDNCTITVTDASSNASSPLSVTEFTISNELLQTIGNSARFNDDDSAYLSRTYTSSATYTFSAWVKRGNLGSIQPILGSTIKFNADDTITAQSLTTTAVFRDPSAWIHILVSNNGLYIDNVSYGSVTTSAQTNTSIGTDGSNYFDGYLSDVYFIDGQALTPSSFGETHTDTGKWIPAAYSGTYGTNGFHLEFESSGNLGDDTSGNTNDWTSNNLDATDQVVDTPTNNFATLNPLINDDSYNLSDGNLKTTAHASGSNRIGVANMAITGGQWYWEVTLGTQNTSDPQLGVRYTDDLQDGTELGDSTEGWSIIAGTGVHAGKTMHNNVLSSSYTTFSSGDTVQIAVDKDTNKIWWGKNGTWLNSGDPAAGTNAMYNNLANSVVPGFSMVYSGSNNTFNFGANATSSLTYYATSTGYFKYEPPTGYSALSSGNLPITYRQYDDSVLYIDGDGTDASTTFTDEAKSHHAITANGDAQLDTAQSKFGGASMLFDGTGDYLSIPDSDDWDFGSGDFTIDAWVRVSASQTDATFTSQWEQSGNQRSWLFYMGAGKFKFMSSANGSTADIDMTGTTSINGGSWYHVAVTRSGTTCRIFVNGTVDDTDTCSNAIFDSTASLMVGADKPSAPELLFNGHIDDLRITKGLARWTTNFTPPTSAHGAPYTTQNKIQDPSDYFDIATYTGNGSTQSITGLGFQPDFTWLKSRSAALENMLFDSVRGVTKYLRSNSTGAETTTANTLTSFNSDGFSLGGNADTNRSPDTFVSWNWKAGGTASSNTDGTITSSVSANPTSGFSVVTYTANNSVPATVGHGLGSAPEMILFKRRSQANNWAVYHKGMTDPANQMMELNLAQAVGASNAWNNTVPTSEIFTIGDATTNYSNTTYVAYAFDEIPGYSKIGSYEGNNSSDGPFVYTGFKPRWIMIKNMDLASQDWMIYDTARDEYNETSLDFKANEPNTENSVSGDAFDILSNGFKHRNTSAMLNSDDTYIYYAVAEEFFGTPEQAAEVEASSGVVPLWFGMDF